MLVDLTIRGGPQCLCNQKGAAACWKGVLPRHQPILGQMQKPFPRLNKNYAYELFAPQQLCPI